MRRMLLVIAWGLTGILVTGALTAGAWALAGKEISQPAPATFPAVAASSSPKPTETPDAAHGGDREGKPEDPASPTATPAQPSGGDSSSSGHGSSDDPHSDSHEDHGDD